MQTFLPYPSFEKSMACLDPSRLGNQIYREAMTLLRGGWLNHPASKMWAGCTEALALYGLVGIMELEKRGLHYPSTKIIFQQYIPDEPTSIRFPHWLGDDTFHKSHQSNLLRKNPEWYGQFGWDVPSDLPYVWPSVVEVPQFVQASKLQLKQSLLKRPQDA